MPFTLLENRIPSSAVCPSLHAMLGKTLLKRSELTREVQHADPTKLAAHTNSLWYGFGVCWASRPGSTRGFHPSVAASSGALPPLWRQPPSFWLGARRQSHPTHPRVLIDLTHFLAFAKPHLRVPPAAFDLLAPVAGPVPSLDLWQLA